MSDATLEAEHSKEAIAARIDGSMTHSDLGDFVLGAVDGAITTFAIVTGVAGANLERGAAIAFVLGLANVLADGFSMAASNYLKARSDLQNIENYRQKEQMHIQHVPHHEKEEIRQIYIRKGFSGELLEEIVETIARDERLWVNTMLTDEWGLQLSPVHPLRSALLTFFAFLLAGLLPLLPLLLGFFPEYSDPQRIFILSAALTSVVFLATGALRGYILKLSLIKGAVETLLVGGIAASLAYFVGDLLGELIL